MTELSKFHELNASRTKVPWEDRLALIHEQFPTTVQMDWRTAFEDIDLMGRILRDILKVDQSEPGRSGPRPVLDRKRAQNRLRQLMGTDFTELEFPESFKMLASGRSHRQLAEKIGIDRNLVQKLLAGTKVPDIYVMETIAKAFDKHPSFFLEYRICWVLGALGSKMANSPEMTVDLYKKLSGKRF